MKWIMFLDQKNQILLNNESMMVVISFASD